MSPDGMLESVGVALLGISLIGAVLVGEVVDGVTESEGIGIVVEAAALVGIDMEGIAGSEGIGMLMSLRRSPLGEASAEIEIAAAEPATTATNATAEITEEDFRTVVTLCFPSRPPNCRGKLTLLRR